MSRIPLVTILCLLSVSCSDKPQEAKPPTYLAPIQQPTPIAKADSVAQRVLLIGHLYGCYVKDHDSGAYLTDNILKVLSKDVAARKPDAVFFLGDNTFSSIEPEWKILRPHLDSMGAPLYFVQGNHDCGDWKKYAKSTPESVTLGDHYFILLEPKTVYSDEDVTKLQQAIEAAGDKKVHVLMHYRSFSRKPLSEVPEGVNPALPYSGYSNWNAKIAPVLRGKVELVFCGDLYHNHVGRFRDEENDVTYVMVSFRFRQFGPLLYLQMDLLPNGEVSIVPVAVPLDLRDGWYAWGH